MIRIIWWGLLALIGVALALFAVSEQGQVVVHWSGWLLETSVGFVILVLVLLAALAYGVLRTLMQLLALPDRYRLWRAQRRAEQPMQQVVAGMQALALQQDDKALALLTTGKDTSQWIRYVLAAELAHAHQQTIKRDSLLAQALALAPEQAFTIQLLSIRWLLTEDAAQALILIDALRETHPKQRTLKILRAQALEQCERWQDLLAYLPEVKKVLSHRQYQRMQLKLFAHRLTLADDYVELAQLWEQLSTAYQRQPWVVQAYVRRALTWGKRASLWTAVMNSLHHHWDEQSLLLLAQLMGNDLYHELKQVGQLQQRHAGEPLLWWLSGLLAQQQGMLEMAEHDFKHSLDLGKTVQAALALSSLYAQQHNAEAGRLLLSELLQSQMTASTPALPALVQSAK